MNPSPPNKLIYAACTLSLLLACAPSSGHAEAGNSIKRSKPRTGFYVGVGGGVTYADPQGMSESEVGRSLRSTISSYGYTSPTATFNRDMTAGNYKLYAGYTVNKNVAVEMAFVDLGKVKGDLSASGIYNNSTTISVDGYNETKVRGATLAGVLKLPFNSNRSAIFAKAGGLLWHADSSSTTDLSISTTTLATLSVNDSNTGLSVMGGAGAEHFFDDHFGVRAEWEYYHDVGSEKIGKADVHAITGSVVYRH
ncbi:MAG: outer membrane beta-barrel protein [Magnetococcales bacterium]|nr:outer membrane beta-barrel protein [Magnetococcales bacterium]